jgi:hypothetical protein
MATVGAPTVGAAAGVATAGTAASAGRVRYTTAQDGAVGHDHHAAGEQCGRQAERADEGRRG